MSIGEEGWHFCRVQHPPKGGTCIPQITVQLPILPMGGRCWPKTKLLCPPGHPAATTGKVGCAKAGTGVPQRETTRLLPSETGVRCMQREFLRTPDPAHMPCVEPAKYATSLSSLILKRSGRRGKVRKGRRLGLARRVVRVRQFSMADAGMSSEDDERAEGTNISKGGPLEIFAPGAVKETRHGL